MPAMRLDRRWWIAIGLAVVVVAVVVLSRTVFGRSAEDCDPVRDLLAFNRSQAALISSKESDDAGGVPSVAEDAVYQQWADGLAERAEKVNAPDLTAQAVQVANLATQFVAKLPLLRSDTAARAPGAPPPPVVYEMSALNDRITDQLNQLTKACPD